MYINIADHLVRLQRASLRYYVAELRSEQRRQACLLVQLVLTFRAVSIEVLAHVHGSQGFPFCGLRWRVLDNSIGLGLIKWVQMLWSLRTFKGITAVIIRRFLVFFS